jgi:hypothetical protein
MPNPNPYAPPVAEVADIKTLQEAPPLWNPRAAANWSLLFSPVFGAVVHMKNWQALGQTAQADNSRMWAIGCIMFFVVVALVGGFFPESKGIDAIARACAIGLLIGWYYASGKSQQTYVEAKFGKTYPRRGWLKPLLFAVLALMGFVVCLGLVGFVVGAVTGTA